MHISYKKLWKLLIDRELMKKDLCEMAGISSASMAKLGKNENVNTDIIFANLCSFAMWYLWHYGDWERLRKIEKDWERLRKIEKDNNKSVI